MKIKTRLTNAGMNELIKSEIVEMLDFPRKEMLEAFKEVKIENSLTLSP